MNQSYLPSKTFIRNIGILIICGFAIWGMVRLAQYIHQRIVTQATNTKAPQAVTLATLKDRDTDGDGVPDWEEPLWGMDPNNPDTLGTGLGDLKEIQKKKELLNQTTTSGTTSNESDAFVQNFFTAFLSLKNSGNLTPANMQVVIDQLQKDIGTRKDIADIFTTKDITTVPNSLKNKKLYMAKVSAVLNSPLYDSLGSEQAAIEQFVTPDSTVDTSSVTYFSHLYKDVAQKLSIIPVPQDGASAHLLLINTYAKIGTAIENLSKTRDNPIVGLEGLGQYKQYTDSLATVETVLQAYLQK